MSNITIGLNSKENIQTSHPMERRDGAAHARRASEIEGLSCRTRWFRRNHCRIKRLCRMERPPVQRALPKGVYQAARRNKRFTKRTSPAVPASSKTEFSILIADEVQGVGTVDHAPVYPREIMRRALELSASAIILVHNHPSGDPQPSTDDIHLTHQIIAVGKPLKVAVHDHLIIGKHGHASLKGLRLI